MGGAKGNITIILFQKCLKCECFLFGSHGPIKEPYYHFFKGELWVSPHLTNMSQISMPYYSDSKSKHTKKDSNYKKKKP
jgi:hypothetical protein